MRRSLVLALLLCTTGCARSSPPGSTAPEPSLTVRVGSQARTFSRAQLVADPAALNLSIPDRSAYAGNNVTYRAVPLKALFAGFSVKPGQQLHYETSDGFSSSLPADRALAADEAHAIAYLAVEERGKPWPQLGNRPYSAGPFYLVWRHPELSHVGREEWPYQVKSLTLQPPVEQLYPAILPDPALPRAGPVWHGYRAWLVNCFPCHTMNGQGAARLGPDLNLPMNPTEYLQPAALRQLIRNPRSVRSWPDSKMPPFGPEALPERDLDQVITYLGHMAGRRH